ncbi:MAG: AlpA family phage regulatory protein [Desulfuromonadales bacterium]
MKPIRRKPMLAKTGLAASTQWRLESKGLFPKRKQLTVGLVCWDEDEIDQWLADLATVTVGSVQAVAPNAMRRGRKPKNWEVANLASHQKAGAQL